MNWQRLITDWWSVSQRGEEIAERVQVGGGHLNFSLELDSVVQRELEQYQSTNLDTEETRERALGVGISGREVHNPRIQVVLETGRVQWCKKTPEPEENVRCTSGVTLKIAHLHLEVVTSGVDYPSRVETVEMAMIKVGESQLSPLDRIVKGNQTVEKLIRKCSEKWAERTKKDIVSWPEEGSFDPKLLAQIEGKIQEARRRESEDRKQKRRESATTEGKDEDIYKEL